MIFKNIKEKEEKNTHFFYVMGWKDDSMKNAPIYKEKFDIYDRAVKFFNKLLGVCGYVVLFENIGGKRKWIADTEDMSNL